MSKVGLESENRLSVIKCNKAWDESSYGDIYWLVVSGEAHLSIVSLRS